MYQSENLRVKVTPSGGFILDRRVGEEWETYYSISGVKYQACSICGFPLKENQECTHHKGLLDLNLETKILFIGYYQTDFNSQPLNTLSKRLLSIRAPEGLKYINELFLLLNILFLSSAKDESIKWGTWVPTSNYLLGKIATHLMLENNLILINPNELFQYNKNTRKIKSNRDYVKEKYQLRTNIDSKYLKIINNKTGVIIDDIIHTCFTIGRILELIETIKPKKVLCLVLGRTARGKHPSIIKYPNLP